MISAWIMVFHLLFKVYSSSYNGHSSYLSNQLIPFLSFTEIRGSKFKFLFHKMEKALSSTWVLKRGGFIFFFETKAILRKAVRAMGPRLHFLHHNTSIAVNRMFNTNLIILNNDFIGKCLPTIVVA